MNGRPAARIYISRAEEDDIRRDVDAVRADHKSRAVLLYGDGGVGKTALVRHMADERADDGRVWLQPVDVDDAEIWLLSNLERRVADQLDGPDGRYFAAYRRELSRLPSATSADISHETIISHLNRLREVFTGCYADYVSAGKKTVVIVFDTVETIRGTNLGRTLTQWMKALPADTLFVLSGRAPAGDRDQLKAELDSRYRSIPVATIEVRGFSRRHAHDYIRDSGISGRLIGAEEEALVLLSRGHPLWLAFLIDYLRTEGVPPEATRYSLPDMERDLPFDRAMTDEGQRLHEEFLRRLVAPYQESDFWHEAIKRLAVVRQPVAKTVWQRLMSDRALSAGVSMDAAWEEMLERPWIRPRSNRRYVTLHDAVAEEFARRLFPLHDHDQRWRHGIWQKALEIYDDLAAEAQPEVERMRAALDEGLERLRASRPADDAEVGREAQLMSRSVELDARQRQLDQLRAASLYYTFLTDFRPACQRLLESYDEAGKRHDSFFQDLLVLYLDRFLPGRASSGSFNDVIRLKLDEFRDWLNGAGRGFYVALGIMVGRYLVDSAQAEEALEFLAGLPEEAASDRERHDLYLLRGNACLRADGKVKDAIDYFQHAIDHAQALDTPDQHKLIAEAYKERGFYYRNTGEWDEAELSYQHAWEMLVNAMSAHSPDEDREELASIQTNWAYIKGLEGSYGEGIHLAETAAGTRRRLKKPADEGLSWSVCGEVYRYARRFEMAWRAYAQAERLLTEERPYWDRLGLVYQQQAICLYQAGRDGIAIGTYPKAEAERRIQRALELCQSYAIRAYPSALNRAGRIIGARDPDAGLKYLEEGISEARRLFDGWFWFANLIEYAELSYRRWRDTEEPRYRDNIEQRSSEIDRVAEDYSFPDLKGRWSLLRGHLAAHDYENSGDVGKLDEALAHYEKGFPDLATRHVGSSGLASLNAEFAAFESIFSGLPENVKEAWQARLRSTWTAAGEASMLLLGHLEELVIGLPGEV
jgi:tetratricopeptide (TPR) repeat protein/GTPase SAR1 family protein